jgi:methyltransferase-like protein/SAM-dependent methyltransferase
VSATDASSYDRIPYRSLALPQTHPDRLATIARVFRLTPPDVGACRVLELGCASAGNLVPMAFNLPGSEFVGIDTSRLQVDDARSAIAALGLRNLRVEQASILDIDDSWGQFDYIIAHGVVSWVDTAVQDRILEVAAANLSPFGVAYISYNTYPGWHMREMVRHMMRFHARQFAEPQEQIDQARALLTFLASASQDSGPYGQFVAAEADRAARAPDSYVFHEHLEATNQPLYFHQFMDRAERAGLQYLSEAALTEMLTSHFPPAVATTLERISPDLLHLEQYMDFVRNRQFRQTLLCHEARQPVRSLTPDVMLGQMISSAVAVEGAPLDLSSGDGATFVKGTQRATVRKPASKAAFALLMEAWPRALDVNTLCELALERSAPFLDGASVDDVRQGMLEDLFGAMMYGLADLHTQAPPCTNHVAEAPRAHPIAAFQAHSSSLVTDAHHHVQDLDPLSLEIVKLLDGTRTREELLEVLMQWFETGRLQLDDGTTAAQGAGEVRTLLQDRLDRALRNLTQRALLVE